MDMGWDINEFMDWLRWTNLSYEEKKSIALNVSEIVRQEKINSIYDFKNRLENTWNNKI